jgi:CRISPR/Cas system-associated endoribonuclease Cas2
MGEGTTKKLKSAADITENTKIRKPKSTFEGKVRQAAGEKCKEKHKQSEKVKEAHT